MIINIDKVFYIDKDELCYTLKEHTGKYDKKDKEIPKAYGYFSTLEDALNKLKNIKVESAHDELSLAEYIKELKEQTRIIKNSLSEVLDEAK